MIVYNVKRQWFPMKGDAEAYRKAEGLKPNALATVTVNNREDLAALLNALCEPQSSPAIPKAVAEEGEAIVQRAYVDPRTTVPDCVPAFLVRAWEASLKRTSNKGDDDQ